MTLSELSDLAKYSTTQRVARSLRQLSYLYPQSINNKLISIWARQTLRGNFQLPPEPRHGCNHPYTQISP